MGGNSEIFVVKGQSLANCEVFDNSWEKYELNRRLNPNNANNRLKFPQSDPHILKKKIVNWRVVNSN